MAEATNSQMQDYADAKMRPRAEQFRAIDEAMSSDKETIDEVYQRAAGANPWADARTDGPPNLLTHQDVLVYNAIITLWAKFRAGTATAQDSADFAANWPVFMSFCVRT